MTLEELKKGIAAGDESALKELSAIYEKANKSPELTVDTFETAIKDNPEIKKAFDKLKDRAVTDGIKTFEEKTLPERLNKKVEEELAKRKQKPDETPEQIAIREMQEKIMALETEKEQGTLLNKALDTLKKKGFDHDTASQLTKFVKLDAEENIEPQVESISKAIETLTTNKVTAELKKHGIRQTVEKGGKEPHNTLGYNPYSDKNRNLTDQIKLSKENPELAAYLKATANQ